MDIRSREKQEGETVAGFEVPDSPDSSYNNPPHADEEDNQDVPLAPPHLHHSPLNFTTELEGSGNLPLPQNVTLNHLYIQTKDRSSPVVALGMTQRYHGKCVSLVVYKPTWRGSNMIAHSRT